MEATHENRSQESLQPRGMGLSVGRGARDGRATLGSAATAEPVRIEQVGVHLTIRDATVSGEARWTRWTDDAVTPRSPTGASAEVSAEGYV